MLTLIAFLLAFALAAFGYTGMALFVGVAGVLVVQPVYLALRYLAAVALLPVVLWADRASDRYIQRAADRKRDQAEAGARAQEVRMPVPVAPGPLLPRTPWGTLRRPVAA